MMPVDDRESGFVGEVEVQGDISSELKDVEILRTTRANVIARGRRFGRFWLLKGLRSDLRDSTSARRQMMKEFEIHSRLSHPLIVSVAGVENVEGIGPCIVQEWVEGETLSDLLRKGSLSKAERRKIMLNVIEGVAYMHSRGVVHRDLKPANIMVRNAGSEPVIVDFGLADSDDYAELKQSAGTVGFISPEQIARGGTNTADDVYSLGVMMNEVCPAFRRIASRCTGKLSRRPENAAELLKLIRRRRRSGIIILFLIILLMVGVVGALVAKRLHYLVLASDDAKAQVAALTEENRNHAIRVSQLTDSLKYVTDRMHASEQELDRVEKHKQLLETIYNDGCRKLMNVLEHYDRDLLSQISPDEIEYFNQQSSLLLKELDKTIKDYCVKIEKSDLTKQEVKKIEADLWNYCGVVQSDYYKKWTKKLFPQK